VAAPTRKAKRSQLPHLRNREDKPGLSSLRDAEWTFESPEKQLRERSFPGPLPIPRFAEFDEYLTNSHTFNRVIQSVVFLAHCINSQTINNMNVRVLCTRKGDITRYSHDFRPIPYKFPADQMLMEA
jgi:hypothetical protein